MAGLIWPVFNAAALALQLGIIIWAVATGKFSIYNWINVLAAMLHAVMLYFGMYWYLRDKRNGDIPRNRGWRMGRMFSRGEDQIRVAASGSSFAVEGRAPVAISGVISMDWVEPKRDEGAGIG